MTGLAAALVLTAAVLHAGWNFWAKRAGGGPVFLWLVMTLASVVYGPLAVGFCVVTRPAIGIVEFAFIAGSGLIHVGYFLMLLRGYREGDLSLVYPLARGTGPTLTTIVAILLLGERPTGPALVGSALVITGVIVLSLGGSPSGKEGLRKSLLFGVLTGCFIAGYTVWDKYSVGVLMIPPLVLEYGSILLRAVMLSPYAWRRWAEVGRVWREHRREAFAVALLSPLAYLLVLVAMVFTPVSYVAPLREVSVLIAVALGAGLLKEGHGASRAAAAGLIVAGVVCLTLN